MAKPNYSFEKRQRELAKKKKKEQQRQKKISDNQEQSHDDTSSVGVAGQQPADSSDS